MPVSNSKEYIIPGWAAGLWPFWGRGLCVVGGALSEPALCGMCQQIPRSALLMRLATALKLATSACVIRRRRCLFYFFTDMSWPT